jgi:hypothetical protein
VISIESAICEHLANELIASPGADVQAVYQLIVEQSPELPVVRVQLVDENRPPHLRGPAGACFARIQTDVYVAWGTESYTQAYEIMQAIEDALFPQPFQAGGSPPELQIMGAFPQGRQPAFVSSERKMVTQTQDFFVWWRRM